MVLGQLKEKCFKKIVNKLMETKVAEIKKIEE
jgi:hypothetical protein